MKKIISVLLMMAVMLSAFIPALSVSAQDGNSSQFVADFTTTDNWTGLTNAIHTTDGWFGSGRGGYGNTDEWYGLTGTITTVDSYDFGEEFTANFQLLSGFSNSDKINKLEDYTVTIGKFKIAICDFQTRIVLYYDGQEVKGNYTAKGDTAYDRNHPTRDYTYNVKISKGNIVIESDLLIYTSNLKTYDAVNNAQISLSINETWHIGNSFFKSFSASAYVPNKTSFTADFSSTDGFEGHIGAINTDEKWFGTKGGFNGATGPWDNQKGTITTVERFDFGSIVDATALLYTFYANDNKNNVNEDYYISIGDFKIAICDFQTRIKVYYNSADIGGTNTAKDDISYPLWNNGIRNYNYAIHIEAGNITVESDLIKYTSTFADFGAINDAAVALTINENWQISVGKFTALSVTADLRTADSGDVNADGQTNADDIALIRRWLLGIDGNLVWRFIDVNGDSSRNIIDLIRLKKILSTVNNATAFSTDFDTTGDWTGDVSAINTTDGWYGSKAGFNGASDGWHNPKTTITTAANYDFGTALTADFALYTRYPNNSAKITTDKFDVIIGDFTIRISAFQNQITLFYNNQQVASVWNEVYTYGADDKGDYNYTVYIAPGVIKISQYKNTTPLLVLDSDFADFVPLDNVKISLKVTEDWEINEAHFGSLNVTAIPENAKSFTADFSTKDNWTGALVDNINTVPMWFGTQASGFGNKPLENGNGYQVWENPTGMITANEKVDLGRIFDAQFKIYTKSTNDSGSTTYNAYRITIGDFRITVLGNQVGIKVEHNGVDIGGNSELVNNISGEKHFTYNVHIEPGNITVVSDAVSYTSNFADFDAVVNAEISLEILERWHIGSGRITDFTVTKCDDSYNSVAVKNAIVGGTVTLDKNIAKEGETVTVTVSPAEGYMLAAGSLYYEETNGTKVYITDSSDGETFSFVMPDSNVSISATFTQTAETELSVSAVSFYPNNEDVAHSDGISVTSAVYMADADKEYYLNNGENFKIEEYGISVTDSQDSTRFISAQSVTNKGKIIEFTTVVDGVDDWTKNYAVTPCVKLVSDSKNRSDLLGDTKEVSLNSAAGLTSDRFVEASYVDINKTKNYIVHNGKPYINNGVQAQINRRLLSGQPDNPVEFNNSIRPVFEKAAELNYNTLVYMMPWRFFESTYDVYNYNIIKLLFDCANEFDLNIQIIWGGSDVCGEHITWVPSYISSDNKTYSLFSDSQKLDYADKDLIYREKKAFSKLLDALYIYDTQRRTVAIQIENEPNTGIDGVPNHNSLDDVKANIWVGQEKAVKSLINELAVLCDTGAYRCVTRVNYVAYTCHFNGVYNSDPINLINDTAIDIVGFSAYGSLNHDQKIINLTSVENNVPHLAESHGGTMLTPAKMLYSVTRGGGFLQYELDYVNGYSGEYCVLNADGSYRDGSEGGNITTEVISVNKMLNALYQKIAVLPYENMTVLNLSQSLECEETVNVCGAEISYSYKADALYGAVGAVICDTDGVYYIYQSRDFATFTFNNKEIKSISAGTFENGEWVEKKSVTADQSFEIGAEDALCGYIYRVVV